MLGQRYNACTTLSKQYIALVGMDLCRWFEWNVCVSFPWLCTIVCQLLLLRGLRSSATSQSASGQTWSQLINTINRMLTTQMCVDLCIWMWFALDLLMQKRTQPVMCVCYISSTLCCCCCCVYPHAQRSANCLLQHPGRWAMASPSWSVRCILPFATVYPTWHSPGTQQWRISTWKEHFSITFRTRVPTLPSVRWMGMKCEFWTAEQGRGGSWQHESRHNRMKK